MLLRKHSLKLNMPAAHVDRDLGASAGLDSKSSSSQSRERRFVWGVFFAAAVARLLSSSWAPDIDAAGLYLRRAQEILRQLPWTGILWTYWVHPPGVSLLVAPALASGLGYKGAQVTIALLSATAVPALWLVARYAGLSTRAAGAWCLVLCLSPAFFFSGGQVVPDVPLAALAIWMIWATQKQSIWFATIVAVLAVMMKEEALALSTMGFIAALINHGYASRKTWQWLSPIALSTLAIACWYSFVGLSNGYVTNSAHLQEFAFTVHQVTHPLACIKRAAYVTWQAVFLVGMGAACVPLVSMVFGLALGTTRDCLKSRATCISAAAVGLLLLGWHSIVGNDVLVRYMLPAAALFIGAGAAAGDNHLRAFGRSVSTKILVVCATTSFVWLLADVRFLGKGASVTTVSAQNLSKDILSIVFEHRGIRVILDTRQAAVSPRIYEDTYVLREIERFAAERHLVFIGTSALFATQIEIAMNHAPLELTSNWEKNPAILINNFTPRDCALAIAKIAQDPVNSMQLHATEMRSGDSVAYIVQSPISTPECKISAKH
jgi:hypothetical protein